MRRYFYGFGLLLPLFLGCSGKHVVAGEEKTKAEQLEEALPSWCETTCQRLRACPESAACDCAEDVCSCVGVDENCETHCQSSFAAYVDAGEDCAAIGESMKSCIDGISCQDLGGQGDPCPVARAERDKCPDPNNSDVSGPSSSSGTAGSAAGDIDDPPSAGVGGTSGVGTSSGSAGTASVAIVSCQGSYGTGGVGPDVGGSQVICEEGRGACSDGHTYDWFCAQDSQERRACSCLLDGQVVRGFEPVGDCPTLAEVNVGCAWGLTQ